MLKGQQKPPGQACLTSRGAVLISCPWLTLQVLAQGPEKRPYASRPAVPKLSVAATLPITMEATLEAGHSPAGYKKLATGVTQACTCPSQEDAAAGRG